MNATQAYIFTLVAWATLTPLLLGSDVMGVWVENMAGPFMAGWEDGRR